MSDPQPTADTAPPSTPPADGESSLRDLTVGSAGAMVLLVLVFVCYAWATKGGYVWDDAAYVTGNATLRDFNGLSRIWTQPGSTPQYYPLTFTSFWLEIQAFGFKPAVSHVINAVLHAGCVLLLWKILRRLAVPGAWFAAAVFAVHPMNVESVAWIAERKNTLSMILALSASYLYLAYARLGTAESAKPAGEGFNVPMPDDPKRLYRLFLALFVLAMLAKTAVAPLPLMLLAIVWWQRGRLTKADIVSMLPAIAIAIAGGLVTSYFEHSTQHVGASGAEWDVSIAQKLLLVGQTTLFYFLKLLWPFPVGYSFATHTPVWPFAISFNYYRWTPDPTQPLQWLPLAGLVGVLATLWALRGRIGRGAFTTGIVFLLGLAPVSGIAIAYPMRYSWVADHFAYVGQIALIVGVVAVFATLMRRRESIAAGLGSTVLAAMIALTLWHAAAFTVVRGPRVRNLWERTLVQNPKSWLAAVNYGEQLMDIANEDYALRASAGDTELADKKREEWRGLADQWLRAALRLKPDGYEAQALLGDIAFQRGNVDEALTYYHASDAAATRLNSSYWKAKYRIGEAKLAQGHVDEAIAIFKNLESGEARSIRNSTLFAQIHTRLGDALQQQAARSATSQPSADQMEAIIAEYDTAMNLAPDYIPPKLRLAGLLIEQQPTPDGPDPLTQALELIQQILKQDVDNIDAKLLTARIAEKQGRPDLAAAQLDDITKRFPAFIPAQLRRAIVLQGIGQAEEAKAGLRRMLTKYPDAKPAQALLDRMEGRATTQPSTQSTLPIGPPLPTPMGP